MKRIKEQISDIASRYGLQIIYAKLKQGHEGSPYFSVSFSLPV